MGLYDWLLFLHVLSAFVAMGAVAALWALVLGTRVEAPLVGPDSALRFGRVGGVVVGAGMGGALVFGIWLAIFVDGYELWDGWILASLVLWALGGWAGGAAGKAFERGPELGRRPGIRLHALSSLALVVTLILMVWKPGA